MHFNDPQSRFIVDSLYEHPVAYRAENEGQQSFHKYGEDPYLASCWLKVESTHGKWMRNFRQCQDTMLSKPPIPWPRQANSMTP